MSDTARLVVLVAIAALVVWRLYRRGRRLIGRQRSRTWRHAVSVILLPLVLAMIALGAWFANPDAEWALAGGVAIGAALAMWGLRLTRFERSGEDWYYTPNARIGLALMALLAARVGYRLFELARAYGGPMRNASQEMMRSPLTLAIVGTVLAYYAAYSAGLLRWRLRER